MVDKNQLIAKYKGSSPKEKMRLHDGGIVIGIEADEENKAWYVIKRGEEITIESGWNQKVRNISFDSQPIETVTVRDDLKNDPRFKNK